MQKFTLGKPIPNFTLPSTTDMDYDFEKYRAHKGGWHFLVFFRGSWCLNCTEELIELEKSIGFFEKKNIHFTTVSTDHLDALKSFVKEHNFTFPVLSDKKLDVIKAYDVFYHTEDAPYEDHGAHGEPAYFLVDEKGMLLYQQRQTSPFGRPSPKELRKITTYIKKNLK